MSELNYVGGFKIRELRRHYKRYTDYIVSLQTHINNLENNYIIDISKKN